MTRIITSSIVLALFALYTAGCSQGPPIGVRTDPGADLVTVSIPASLDIIPSATVTMAHDVDDLYRTGLALNRAGRHRAAGDWFMEAAVLESEGDEWTAACASAAACEYLQCGDITAFNRAARTVEGALGRWGTLAPPPLAELVVALYQAASGDADTVSMPRAVDNIFNWEESP